MKKFPGVTVFFPPLAALLLSALLAACGGGGGGGQDPILGGLGLANNLVAPTVTAVTPLANTTVPLNIKALTATFSRAMDSATLLTSFKLACPTGNDINGGTVSYTATTKTASMQLASVLPAGISCTATINTGARASGGLALTAPYVWSFTTSASADNTPPTVTNVSPVPGAINVAVGSSINATFSEPMDPTTLKITSFTLQGSGAVGGSVSMSGGNTVATFAPSVALTNNTLYTATISTAAQDVSGNPLTLNYTWTFTTAGGVVLPVVDLATVRNFGTFGGTAGMTNMGTLTMVNGDIGTTATTTSSITGFHDSLGDIYTQTPSNIGTVTGAIYTCTNSITGPTSGGVNAASCAIATQGKLDAQAAYLALVAMAPLGGSPAPGQNLAGLTLLPGVYKSASGDFMIQGGNLTLDAQGDANASWVFQMATTLTVGGPGAAFPQSIVLAGGALAKNVFWQVGSAATINAAGGGTMVGTIIAQAAASFSTAGNVIPLILNGRAMSMGASVTLVNTVITVPAP